MVGDDALRSSAGPGPPVLFSTAVFMLPSMAMMQSSQIAFVLMYATILIAVQLAWLCWKRYTGPLRSIPGPWHSRYINWRLKWAVLSGRRVHYVHSLHQKYGSIVRLSPDEVAVADAASYREIYHVGSGFNKTEWYCAVGENEHNIPSIFNMTCPKVHAVRRKLLAKGFSQRHMRDHCESIVQERAAFAVQRIKHDISVEGTADVLKWWTFMAADIAAALSFGESFRMLELGYKVPFVDALQKALIQVTLCWEVPILYKVLKWLPLASLAPVMNATKHLHEQGSRAVKDTKLRGISEHSIFATMLAESEKLGVVLSDDDLRVEAGNFIVAGSDTTANTLTYLTWAVLKRPKLHRELLDELDTVDDMSDAALEKLPLLNAVLDESLRLYGAVPATLPRRTPSGGVTLHGYFIPEGTVVGTQTFSLHRNSDVFPDPERLGLTCDPRFDHTRYLPSTPPSPVAKASFSPFSAGSAACLGMHLARMELRMAAAHFFTACRSARLAPGATDECMAMENFFIITPRGHKCEITM